MKKRTVFDLNEIIIKDSFAEIVLCDAEHQERARAIIDTEDVKKIQLHRWYLSTQGYAVAHVKNTVLKIQHIVLSNNPSQTILVDHKDRNPLNNKKNNLRLCTKQENNRNRCGNHISISGYKGVHKVNKKWRVQIGVNGKKTHLGYFKEKIDAAMAYNKAAVKLHGEFAYLNKV